MSLVLAIEIFILVILIVEIFTLSYKSSSLVGCTYGSTGRWMTVTVLAGLFIATQAMNRLEDYNASKSVRVTTM